MWAPRRLWCKRVSSNGHISQCKGNDLHEEIERQKVVLRRIVANPNAELPLTMECVAAMGALECVGGQTGPEAQIVHDEKVRHALNKTLERVQKQYVYFHCAETLPYALISSQYQQVMLLDETHFYCLDIS